MCKTINIAKEILLGARCIDKGIQNKNKSDKELEKEKGIKSSKYKKYRDIAKYENLIFKLIIINISEEKALLIESQYAHDNNALFWNPSSGQFKYI